MLLRLLLLLSNWSGVEVAANASAQLILHILQLLGWAEFWVQSDLPSAEEWFQFPQLCINTVE